MNIGAVIKEKRQKKDLTQEQLAEYLNVSVSAVSQWESGKTTPDFSLLIPLANFFDVSLDELLGRTPGEKEKALAEYDEKEMILTNKGEIDAAIALWREALSRFPGDFHCMDMLTFNLLHRIFAGGYIIDTANTYAKEAVSLCEQILRDCTDEKIRGNAIQNLVYLYSRKDLSIADEKKAVEYANMASDRYFCKEKLLEYAYFTEESKDKLVHIKHENRISYMDFLVSSLMYEPNIPIEEHLQALEASIKLWQILIYDENYLFFHNRLSDIYRAIAEIHAIKQRKKETLEALEKALFHAQAYDTLPEGEQHYTSVFVKAATFDKSKTATNTTQTQLEWTLNYAKSIAFLQNDPKLLELIQKYQNV